MKIKFNFYRFTLLTTYDNDELRFVDEIKLSL